jgi:branched-chain amino acid aminotransferase
MADLPDWKDLGFGLHATDWMYRSTGALDRDPVWDSGEYVPFGDVPMSPAAAFLSYGCGVFEGLKAERGADGRVRLFRAMDHGGRFARSAARVALPEFPARRFVGAVAGLVRRNDRFVPPAGAGAFYVRPMMFGIEPLLGARRSRLAMVTMYGSPVGDVFKKGSGVRLKVVESARASVGGTGGAKAAGNYAGAILIKEAAQREGFDDILFLDGSADGHLAEASGANVFCVMPGDEIVTPPIDDTILPGVTRDSVIRIAREVLGLSVSERPLPVAEVMARGRELFCTGTGWSVRPVEALGVRGGEHVCGPARIGSRIREILRGMQTGAGADAFQWTLDVAQVSDDGT